MKKLSLLIAAMMATPAFATTWTTNISDTSGASATIQFDDWGYTGPTGVGAMDFQVGAGFDASRVGQIQTVTTTGPDWKSPDYPGVGYNFKNDSAASPTYSGASMDSTVQFYKWAYTTVAGSTFTNMKIDKAGNYFIAKNDMNFQFYDTFQYHDANPSNGITPDSTYDTNWNFKPYAISDARGWCGSVLTPDPHALAQMAGQVTFDFAFDVYGGDAAEGSTTPATQIVPDFVMRSYGSYVVDITAPNGQMQHYEGSAVINNTNPETGLLDPAFQDHVSFLGAGLIPESVWILDHGLNPDGTRNIEIVDENTAGAILHYNSFGGFGFLLRADGTRDLFYINPEGHSDYFAAAVPEPETYAMMLAGLGLVGAAARRRRAH